MVSSAKLKHLIAGVLMGGASTMFGIALQDSVKEVETVLHPDYLAPVIANLKVEEGFRSKPYHDSRGVLTIGYGTNLDEGITENEAETLLRGRLLHLVGEFAGLYPPFAKMPSQVKSALSDMVYQLGPTGVSEFHAFLNLLEQGEWEEAVADAKGTAWYRETPARADRVLSLIEGAAD